MDIMELITNEMLRLGDSFKPIEYLNDYEKEILPHFSLDVYSYSGYNIFKTILKLAGNAGANNRTTIAYT